MEKYMILIDRTVGQEISILNTVLAYTPFIISTLILDNDRQKAAVLDFINKTGSKRIEAVYTIAEIDRWDDASGLDYDFINSCRPAQLKVENSLTRYTGDYNERKYVYYMASSFWNLQIKRHPISLIVVADTLHGLPYDAIPQQIAKNNNLHFLSYECFGVNPWNRFMFDYSTRELIRINNEQSHCIKEYHENATNDMLNIDLGKFPEVNPEQLPEEQRGEYLLLKEIDKLAGPLGVDVFQAFRHNSFHQRKQIASCGFTTSVYEDLKAYQDFMKTKRYLYAHEKKDVDFDTPYIFYALHFEPEASIQCRLTFEAQLALIKMISQALPPNWKLYIKEHPHQYNINTYTLSYHVSTINLFKTIKYYKRILETPNVVVVSHEYKSEELAKKSVAVAGLVGTIIMETITYKKPILLFSEVHPGVKIPAILKCFSFEQLKAAMQKLQEGYTPDYSDAEEILNQYVFGSVEDYQRNTVGLLNWIYNNIA
ncbi:MAG: hypothetical protein IKN12_08140 [Selenomonadaceae bacterium]|nr:hypothetical protein [Selenomonadaceae bacterium]